MFVCAHMCMYPLPCSIYTDLFCPVCHLAERYHLLGVCLSRVKISRHVCACVDGCVGVHIVYVCAVCICVCVYVCMYVCMCMYVCVCMTVSVCAHLCVCVYLCMCACMCNTIDVSHLTAYIYGDILFTAHLHTILLQRDLVACGGNLTLREVV